MQFRNDLFEEERVPVVPPAYQALETLDRARGVPVYKLEAERGEPKLPMYCASGVSKDACRSISIAVWKEVVFLNEGLTSAQDTGRE
jgi:hypothetical protein